MTLFNNPQNDIDPEFLGKILSDPKVMITVARRSIYLFFYIFFGSYIKYPIASFHLKMFEMAQDENLKRIGVVAFRGSAKSTILNTAYVLWAIMGIQRKKHVVIASQTQQRARDHLKNIRREIESNDLLRKYLGPFHETEDRWSAAVLIIPRYDARITAISIDESIRGLREGPYRPDLMIVDDIEDSNSTKSHEMRKKTFAWITGELLPAGDTNTKAVFIGNFLHEECALIRIEKLMQEGKMIGKFYRFPLLDEENKIAWPGMFPDIEAVENYRLSIGDDVRWYREFLLKVMPDTDQLISLDDIQYYDEIPMVSYYDHGKPCEVVKGGYATGVDLAISKKETADFTAMVSGRVVFINESVRIYIDPNPLNARLNFHETIDCARAIQRANRGFNQFFVENTGYQQSAIQEMQRCGLPVRPMRAGEDKRSRLSVVARYIKSGIVLFPRKGCEDLIRQLVYFGIEERCDAADAFTYLILGLVESGGSKLPKVVGLF